MAAKQKAQSKAARSPRRNVPSRPDVDLAEAPAGKRAAVAKDIQRVLRKHGIAGKVQQLHVNPVRPKAAAAPAAAPIALTAAAAPCPGGNVRRVVCFFRKGTFVCEERCVPA